MDQCRSPTLCRESVTLLAFTVAPSLSLASAVSLFRSKMVYWTEIRYLVDGRIDAELKLLRAQLAYTQNELRISELARAISGILHQHMEDIDLHQLVVQEDELVEYLTRRAGLQLVLAERTTAHGLIEARVRRRVRWYNYRNVITITRSGDIWALDAARTHARRPGVPPNVQIRIQYRVGRTVTLPLQQQLERAATDAGIFLPPVGTVHSILAV
ncbi:hypothetical protein RHGRI_028413 [Rhododendron griersonianum]|uniref:Uncharacterized protein n=1 Tax=Rhododendron griersonianum TaxID=479676 RepID=A0AAV6IJ24_9ERIC|nr:hypothetical protein RHGRI_028413 [Rhododendron griersonianum]